jgi:hypothetical protein
MIKNHNIADDANIAAHKINVAGLPAPTGKTFYVGTDGDAAYESLVAKVPADNLVQTLDDALSLCVANRGDVIYILPGHAESEAEVDGAIATMDVAGVSVIGLGEGSLIPTFSLGDDGATFSLTAANCLLKNIMIKSTVANVAVGLTVGAAADGSIIDGVLFRDDGAAKELLVGISVTAACDNLTIQNCDFRTTAAAGSANAIKAAAVTDLHVINNFAYGKFSTGAMLTTGVLTRAKIIGNSLVNAEAAIGIALSGTTSTGLLAKNFLAGTTSIAAALTGDNAMTCFENYVTGAAAASGLLDPGADAD